jgi:hypothetical protein
MSKPCPLGYVAPIQDVDEASVAFGGRQVVDYGFHMATFNGHQGKAIRRASSNIATYCMPSR